MNYSTDQASPVLQDYKLEEWLRMTYRNQDQPVSTRKASRNQTSPIHWKQRVQFAIGHAINRYYSMSPELRGISDIGQLVDFRWPKRISYFDHEQQYWQVKDLVTNNIRKLLAANEYAPYPMMLYEQHQTLVPELQTDLSVIFQVAWQVSEPTAQPDDSSGHKSLIVQKFIVDDDPYTAEAFIHLSSVFCQSAFGRLPERIDIFSIMEGTVQRHYPSPEKVSASLDYLHLLQHVVPGGTQVCEHCRQNAGVTSLAPSWSLM